MTFREAYESGIIRPIDCNECFMTATWTYEAPPRSATANDWFCDAHLPDTVPDGWERIYIGRAGSKRP